MQHIDPRTQCDGKDKLPTFQLAKQIASRMAHRRGHCITPYQCAHCGFYHVGELIKKRKDKKWTSKPEKKVVRRS